MQTTVVEMHSYGYNRLRTYLIAAFFVVGNLLLPQLCHSMAWGGRTWLPIYFFTLVGAYKYGWRVGVLTAVASPVVHGLLFAMPAPAVLPVVLLKSLLLAGAAGWAAAYFCKASLGALAAVVAAYQLLGTLGEWALVGSWQVAAADLYVGWPGMLMQVFGGWLVINGFLGRK